MSRLEALTQQYLETRQALGYRLHREAVQLPKFARFVIANGQDHVTVLLAIEWAAQTPSGGAQQSARRIGWVRQLARFLHAHDPRTQIPSTALTLRIGSKRSTPYIYRDEDVIALMHACREFSGLKAATFTTLIALLSITGLRIGEVIALNRNDVDMIQRQLTVRSGKLGKARRLPLSHSTCEALTDYSQKRNRAHQQPRSEAFLLSLKGKRLLYRNVHFQFHKLINQIGLGERVPRPRLHDMRHSFAVETLRQWYAEDLEIEPRLPTLSTWLGHLSPSSTYWYLTATPALLELARQRAVRRSGRHL
jgi:integrase/recombinase XerD